MAEGVEGRACLYFKDGGEESTGVAPSAAVKSTAAESSVAFVCVEFARWRRG